MNKYISDSKQQKFQDVSYKANFFIGMNSQGGKITIKDEVFVFTPHSMNLGDMRDKIIQIKDICSYKKGWLTTLYIYLNNGMQVKLAVWNKTEIIKALEDRRYALFNKLGQVPPKLSIF